MKLHKATIYFYSGNNDSPIDNQIDYIKNNLDDFYISVNFFDKESAEIGEWYEDIPINKIYAGKSAYEELMDKESQIRKLIEKRGEIMGELVSINSEINKLGGE